MNARVTPKLIVLIAYLLAVATVFLSQANASENAVLFIDPANIQGTNYAPFTDITIAVLVANISDLSVATFNISYEPLIFSYRSFSLGALSHNPQPKLQTDDKKGFFWANITYSTAITTSSPTTLINITFSILARGETILDLHDTQLFDSNRQPIFHVATDGYFINFNPYDINQDGKIDILDIAIVAHAFGSYPGHPRWNPDADVNRDGVVDIHDIALVAKHFGERL